MRAAGLPGWFLSIFSVFALWVISAPTFASEPLRFDSADQLILDGSIVDGMLMTSATSSSKRESEVRAQLRYMVGQLNGASGGAQIDTLNVTLGGVQGKLVHYSAQLRISWSRSAAFPPSLMLLLPTRGDTSGRTDFFKAFAKECDDGDEYQSTSSNFWYHYRPANAGCPISSPSTTDPSFGGKLVRFPISLMLSVENTQGKHPEYERIWEDSRLVVTLVFTKYASGSKKPDDQGVLAYNATYQKLIDWLGPPKTINGAFPGLPGVAHPRLEMLFGPDSAPIDIHMFLIDSLSSAGSTFRSHYQARTLVSDLVVYSGHAGLGANVRELSRIGKYQPGRYQIFMINACDTFAYADGSLFKAHGAVNPGVPPTRHLDLITDARPAYFSTMDSSAVTLIQALRGRQLSYRQILDQFPSYQGSLVDGEADNPY